MTGTNGGRVTANEETKNGLDHLKNHTLGDPAATEQNTKGDRAKTARSHRFNSLFCQCDRARVNLRVLLFRHVMNCGMAATLKLNRISDDLAVQAGCPAVAADGDRRLDCHDRTSELVVRITVEL